MSKCLNESTVGYQYELPRMDSEEKPEKEGGRSTEASHVPIQEILDKMPQKPKTLALEGIPPYCLQLMEIVRALADSYLKCTDYGREAEHDHEA